MPNFDPQKHQRRSIRLKGHDYTQAGAYFVTVVTWQRECLFGEIVDGEMVLTDFGAAATEEWFKAAEIRENVILHPEEMMLMPNHVHGIIRIVEGQGRIPGAVGAQRRCAPTQDVNVSPGSLGAMVRAYKSAVTRRINALRHTPGLPVWQRNYYEHIIRDHPEFDAIRRYILDNPFQWGLDGENPDALRLEK